MQLESKNDNNLHKLHKILTFEKDGVIHERLEEPVNGKKLRYVIKDNMFEILPEHHPRGAKP